MQAIIDVNVGVNGRRYELVGIIGEFKPGLQHTPYICASGSCEESDRGVLKFSSQSA